METKPKKPKKSQGSIGGGIICISIGVAAVVFMVFAFLRLHEASAFFALILLMAFLAIGCFFMGTVGLYRGIMNRKVANKGKKSTCVIERFDVYGVGRSGSVVTWMDVSYKTESGKEAIYSAKVDNEMINRLTPGTRIECLVLGEECYIDPDNIKKVDEPYI